MASVDKNSGGARYCLAAGIGTVERVFSLQIFKFLHQLCLILLQASTVTLSNKNTDPEKVSLSPE